MGPGIFTESTQGWSVRTQVGRHCCHSTSWLKRRAMGYWAERWAFHWSTALLSQLLRDTGRREESEEFWKEVANPKLLIFLNSLMPTCFILS